VGSDTYKSMTDLQLAQLTERARADLAVAKTVLSGLEGEISRRQETLAADLLRVAGKETGSVSFTANGMKYKAEAAKKVEWDSGKLKEIAGTLPWSHVERLFDIKFSVPERTYGALHDPELVARLNTARTTKIGDLKVSFVGFDVG
jgi:hypothetical protein